MTVPFASDTEIIKLLLAFFVAGRVLGWILERLQMRDWKEWRKFVDGAFLKHETDNERRFEDASERMSKLASVVQAMPTQIEDRCAERFMDRNLATEKFLQHDRRIANLEQRSRRGNNV